MRVSTALIFSQGTTAITTRQSELLRTQQQIASGKRLLSPSDDPLAASESVGVSAGLSQTDQYSANVAEAKEALALNDSVLSQVTDVLQNLRTLAVNGGNGALSSADRASIGSDVQAQLDALVGLANSKDGAGQYLFSGFQLATQPFSTTTSGVNYNGDQGQRTLAVGAGRELAISENGRAIFQQIKNGNGTFAAAADTANIGTGVIDSGTVTNSAALTGDAYRLQFNVIGGTTTYDVIDTTTSATVSTGNVFTSGTAITVAGEEVTITGQPSSGDRFTLTPSANQDVFATVRNLLATLQAPAAPPAGQTQIANGVNQALQNIDQALENVLTTRAGVGARLRELDSLASGNDDRGLQYRQTLSRLQDLDYNQALSDFAQQQLALEAAQKSFVKVSGLSLFNFL